MHDKKVRWSDKNDLFYASPNNSPISSSSGSPGPMTPPPELPGMIASVNEYLRFKRNLGYVVDLQKDPREGNLISEAFAEAATNPPLSQITVVSSRLPFAFRFGESKHGMGVTVENLLRNLHLALQVQVTAEDLEKETPENQKAILNAFENRCNKLKERSIADSVQEEAAGPKRIDYLRGRSIFAGFEVVAKEHPTLRLHVR